MNVQNLLRTDKWIGIPLCSILTLARAIFTGRTSPEARPPRRILFVKLAEQGSTVLAYPALCRAVEIVGRKNVYFIALENNRFILDVLGVIPPENVITVPYKTLPALVRGGLAAIRRIRGLQIDAAVDLEFFSRGSAALTFLTGAARRVGFHPFCGAGPFRGNLMTHRLLYNPQLHTSETFLSLVEAVLQDPAALPTFNWQPKSVADNPPLFIPQPDELDEVREMLWRETGGRLVGAEKTFKVPPLVLLNANASDLLPLRRWPSERYVELARRLLATYPEVFVGFTGAPGEAEATARLVSLVGDKRCLLFAGKTTLRQLLVLYTLSKVLVTNDSGPAHFATLTPMRVVTLFGPETPALFAARTPRNTVLWAGLACSPCVNAYNHRQSPCRDNQCMKTITVEQVLTAVCDAYEQAKA